MPAGKRLRWVLLALLGVAFFLAPFGSTTAAPAGPPNTPTAESKENVSVGLSHTCVVKPNGTLWCTGDNKAGQLGRNNTTSTSTYVQVGVAANWLDVSAGSAHTCATTTAGALYCWGSNANGQLGLGSVARALVPTRVGLLNNWSSITAGSNHTCAINAGKIFCWGANANGQLGIGNTTSKTTPTQVGALTNWIQVASDSSANHTCAINNAGGSSQGSLRCWGLNTNSQVGDNTTTQRTSPTNIGTTSDWKDVAVGATYSCAIRSASNIPYCWGANAVGQLGLGTTVSNRVPAAIPGASGYTDIDAGAGRTCATTGSDVRCWGNGQSTPSTLVLPAPDSTNIPVSSMVEVGGTHECGITTGRKALWCRGGNASGQLGTGNTTTASSPIYITRASQTLTVGTLPTPTYVDETFSVSGLVTTTSDLSSQMTYTVGVGETDCSVSGTTVTINAAGTCSLVATQSGDGLYSSATTSFNVSVSTSLLTVSILPADRTYDSNLPAGRATTASCFLMGVRTGDDVACEASNVLYSTNAAGSRTATGDITLTGDSASNYTVAATGSGTGTINKADLPAFTVFTDGTDGATVTYTAAGTTVALSTSGEAGDGTITYSTLDAD
ncbi:MAG: hypothetical protein KGN04_04755, partial [Chloroflexi bacterium]|nr:hypothetical protein [Chloroflexota bacterium]